MPDASTNLRVLIVEDSADDAALVLRELRKSGYEPVSERVDTASAMRAALHDKPWDIILSDFVMPGFGGIDALLIAKEGGLDLPVILVSGKVGEETAVEAMKAGATDFVMKDRLGRLGSVVKRELADATARKQAESLRTQLAAIVQSSNDAIIGMNTDGVITSWNPGAEKVYGYSAEDVVGKSVSILAPADKKEETRGRIEAVKRGEAVNDVETNRIRKDGRSIDVVFSVSPIKDSGGRTVGVSAIVRDITEKKLAERALLKVNRALKALSDCNLALIHASDEIQLLNEICRVIVNAGGYRLAWVGYVEHDAKKTVRPVAQSGFEPGYMEHADITWADNEGGRGPLGIAIRSGQLQVVQDVKTDPCFEPWRANAVKLGYDSVLVAPLVSDSVTLGALSIYAAGADAFDIEEITLLSELAADMAFGIATLRTRSAHERSAQRLLDSMEATIQAVAGTVEMRDAYTAGHQRRVAELATAIARDMGLAPDQVHGIYLAAVVHDLGKIHIPAEILTKPGKLSAIEFELIKTHPGSGYDILKGVDFPWPIAQIVLQHHERLDGSGYPGGLKGNEIVLEARILMVADVVEAMASHRPYRPAVGIDSALKEIERGRGSAYDAAVVDACLRLFAEKRFAFSS
jgi:PAS domain S-box-containing protein